MSFYSWPPDWLGSFYTPGIIGSSRKTEKLELLITCLQLVFCVCKAIPWPGCFGQPVINKDNAPVKHKVTSCNCIISLKILTQYIKYSSTVEDVYFSFSRLCLYTFRLTWISSKSNINSSVPLWWHSSADSSIDTNNISHYGVHAPGIKSRTKTWL